ncbi:MAG: pseudouridine synthase [Marinobacterium sp.]|nr:pseudouridine synthase [Marinobacterium sp.]
MPASVPCFTPFRADTSSHTLPERFTFPFCYQPHPLCLLAAQELQQHLQRQQDWQHDFSADGDGGKMFGVLLVENEAGELGYLSAFSGWLAGACHQPGFVPPIFDLLADGGFFRQGQQHINQMNERVAELEASPELQRLQQQRTEITQAAEQALVQQKNRMAAARNMRKTRRAEANLLPAAQAEAIIEQLGQESIREKLQLRDLKVHWEQRLTQADIELATINDELIQLKSERKQRSLALQQQVFDQYQFLNIAGEKRGLPTIFAETPRQVPPSGAGDCAAPRLLQYAFSHGLRPVAMAEFWWGASPKSEVRKHGRFYPSCQGKCQPILGHMLAGMRLDDNPLLQNPAQGKALDIIYQDEHLLVLNKPSGFLSVPGKNIADSVAYRMQQMFPAAGGHLIVHRLDMATSGLMVIALNKRAHKKLQKQFINRTVEKRYEALLAGELNTTQGTISLPLRGDYDDLPRQLVCHRHGKPAETFWQTVAVEGGCTRVYLYPRTGRTHQLRVHCAHGAGLDCAIVGDDLYGDPDNRLHLHAGLLVFDHPVTGERLTFEVAADF